MLQIKIMDPQDGLSRLEWVLAGTLVLCFCAAAFYMGQADLYRAIMAEGV